MSIATGTESMWHFVCIDIDNLAFETTELILGLWPGNEIWRYFVISHELVFAAYNHDYGPLHIAKIRATTDNVVTVLSYNIFTYMSVLLGCGDHSLAAQS